MVDSFQSRLLQREIRGNHKQSGIRGLYGHRSWVDDLDIVNELGGHTGCVNALSWSTSGRLLASGSDDQHLNIHTYQSDSATSPFVLTTQVATGHTANIFSVKFMPHSADRTLVSAAGDAEVRVFDIEYAGRPLGASRSSAHGRATQQQILSNVYEGSKYLHDGNTNCRVYRSHADRVKRIVTESSPHLFLTCSEDGEVRQFDLRMPSSAYPAPCGGRGFLASPTEHDDSNVPPPLISYKRYNLDLNSISCSSSRPHYIALGGAHLHCFLHDRRMLGRSFDEERGMPNRASSADSMTPDEEESMSNATRCVRKFAPEGRRRAKRRDERHITACKISDANPNEMIVSWSGDHIYSFDIVKSSDEVGQTASETMATGKANRRSRESRERKRKRKSQSTASPSHERKTSRTMSLSDASAKDGDVVRLSYNNGRTEDVPMRDVAPVMPSNVIDEARESFMTDSQKRSLRIAKSLVKIRKLLFSLEASSQRANGSLDSAAHRTSFTSALGLAAACMPEMKQISGDWRYPVNPTEESIIFQKTLRGQRDSSIHFVQAAGTLARFLGGKLQTASNFESPALHLFKDVQRTFPNNPPLPPREIFSYTFLRAILAWLDGGTPGLVQAFEEDSSKSRRTSAEAFSFPVGAPEAVVQEVLVPHLLHLAGDRFLANIDASRFENDSTRKLFESEKAAVVAFSRAITVPLGDASNTNQGSKDSNQDISHPPFQEVKVAKNFWAFKVGRSLLLNAGEDITFQFVNTSFGGLGTIKGEEDRNQEDIDPNEDDDPVIKDARVVHRARVDQPAHAFDNPTEELSNTQESDEESGEDYDDNNNDDDNEDDDNDEDDEDDEGPNEDGDTAAAPFIFRSTFDQHAGNGEVERNVSCGKHTRMYEGHCNVKTVKDANFFGLQDDYVVSGSDGGHLFIWDKKTSALINILQGDSEVVNVIQGHPYEPLIAASGIDNTIKVFSADARAQDDARNGLNICNPLHGSGRGPRRRRLRTLSSQNQENEDAAPSDGIGLASCRRMDQNYEILSKNKAMREDGIKEAFITRGMLAQLAARLRARQEGGDGGGGDDGAGNIVFGEDGDAVVVDENCVIM